MVSLDRFRELTQHVQRIAQIVERLRIIVVGVNRQSVGANSTLVVLLYAEGITQVVEGLTLLRVE